MNKWIYKGMEDFEIPSGAFGFVYKITSRLDGRKYIGRKYLTASKTTSKRVTLKSGIKKTQKKKSRVESNWRDYMGSCKPLLEDINRFGRENYQFEILAFAGTKGQVNFLECFFQMRENVLADDSYYNDAIGSGQFRGVKFDDGFKALLKEL
jgi:hypothetical protein